MKFPLTTRVALRYQLRQRQEQQEEDQPKHYARLVMKVKVPPKDPYLQSLQSVAARTTGAIPIIRYIEPMTVTMDLPITHESRRDLKRVLQALPFVESMLLSTGPKIRR